MSAGLFARKGEAVPAGIPVRDPSSKGRAAASSLGFLIQRRMPPAGGDGMEAAPRQVPSFAAANDWPTAADEEYPTAPRAAPAPGAVVGTMTAAVATAPSPLSLMPADDEAEDWRRLSFRLKPEYHRQLKNLSRLWGVSVQSLLSKAVVTFLEQALSGSDPNWRH
jgi:hypothetical protein